MKSSKKKGLGRGLTALFGDQIKDEKKKSIPNNKKVTSPIIGTAYHASEPGGKKFTEVGKKIKKGEACLFINKRKKFGY